MPPQGCVRVHLKEDTMRKTQRPLEVVADPCSAEHAGNHEAHWLAIDELADLLDVRVDHLRALVSRGEIPVGRVGRLVRFHWPTVQRWVTDRGRTPSATARTSR
jgi:excisionase family DNA binding protein